MTMTSEELADIRAYVAQRAAARARGEHIDSDERREGNLIAALDEARAQLAALCARTQTLTNHLVASDGLMEPPPQTAVRANSWAFVSAVEDTRRLLADLATAAAEHERRVREQGIMEGRQEMRDTATVAIEAAKRRGEERDQLAAALAEVRERALMSLRPPISATVSSLAAQREARIRADERARALREARDAMKALAVRWSNRGDNDRRDVFMVAHDEIRAMADEAAKAAGSP